MVARQVGAEPSSPSVQLEHLADLQRNLGNSQQNPSLYEVWRPKIVEDIEKQTVKRLHWDSKVPGICAGNQATRPWPDTCCRLQGGALEHQLPPLPEQGGQPAPGGTWRLEVSGGNTDKGGDTRRRYTSAGTVDASTREIEVPGNIWRREELGCQTLTWIVSRLVRKLGCVKSLVLVKNGRQLRCKELETSGWLARG